MNNILSFKTQNTAKSRAFRWFKPALPLLSIAQSR